ncbi:MAG: RND transporter [Magnetococcales bacterium]|nr:RND transporter [Magnetococcales bacterium]
MGIAPILPEPHLWEKLKMLAAGTLSRPLDIFDLVMHSTPLVLVVIKGWRQIRADRRRL